MRIQWKGGRWQVLEINSDTVIAEADRVAIRVPCELVINDDGRGGRLIVAGQLERVDRKTVVIR